MKTAVIYARYSSDRQTEQSIEGQLRECYEYAKYNDIVVVGTYIDRAMTGTNDNRTDFQRMLKDAQKGEWDLVLVYKLDRFSRNKYEMAIHKKTLKDYGIQLVSAKEHIPEGPEGIILESLLEGMAEYYSVELAQKVSRGQKETRIKGNYFGGGIPYGYRVENKKYVVNEEEAPIVIRIYEMYAAGIIAKKIIETFSNEGISYRGKPFTKNIIYNTLQNERYSGIYTHKTEGVYTNMFPRIVPQHLFELVQNIVSSNRHGKHPQDVVYLLRNKMKCGICGKTMAASTGTSKNGKIIRYYGCTNKKRDTKNCPQTSYRKEQFEKLVTDITIKVLDNPEMIDNLVDKLFEAHQKRIEDVSILNLLEAERDKIKKALDNMLAAVEQGIITATTKQRIEELEQELDVAEAKLLVEKNKSILQITKTDVKKYFFKALRKEPRFMLKALIKEVIVNVDSIEIHYNCIDTKRPDEIPHQAFCFYTEHISLKPEDMGLPSNAYWFDMDFNLYL